VKAWVIYHLKFEAVSIYAATTRGKAIAAILSAARDAGYGAIWSDFRAKRAATFDNQANTTDCRPYPLGYHARAYSLVGDFTGYDQFGCLDGERRHPRDVYNGIGVQGGGRCSGGS
jgi:hypothetical protein